MDFKGKINQLKEEAYKASEVNSNYSIGLLTVNEYMEQLKYVVNSYDTKKKALQNEFDLSDTAISLMLINID